MKNTLALLRPVGPEESDLDYAQAQAAYMDRLSGIASGLAGLPIVGRTMSKWASKHRNSMKQFSEDYGAPALTLFARFHAGGPRGFFMAPDEQVPAPFSKADLIVSLLRDRLGEAMIELEKGWACLAAHNLAEAKPH